MKTVLWLLTVVAFATAIEIETYSVSSSLESLLEDMRDEMPCGFPLLGIGPLAPLFISHRTLDINTPTLKVLGAIQNFTINGLNNFETLNIRHSVIKRKLTFNIYFEKISFDTWYDLESHFQDAGWIVKLNGAGKASFDLKGLLLSGTIKYSISVVSSRVKVKTLKIVPSLEGFVSNIEGILGNGLINEKWNKELEKRVPVFVNTFGELFAQQLEAILLPNLNTYLYQYNLNDLVSGINGNSADGERIKCEVEKDGDSSSQSSFELD